MIPLPFIENLAAAHLWQASLQAGLLVLVVLALRALLGAKLRPRWRVALWLIVFARLALVVAPTSRISLFNVASLAPAATRLEATAPASSPGESAGAVRDASESRAGLAPDPARSHAAEPALAPRITRGFLLLGLWFLGAAGLTVGVLVGRVRIRRKLRRAAPCVNAHVLELLDECRVTLDVRTPVTAMEGERTDSPVLIGAIRPVLLLPKGLAARLGREGLRSVMMHEMAHVKRRDIAIGWATTALLIVHWFNPLVWIAMSRLRADRELACDELALTHLGDAARSSYAMALIELLQRESRPRLLPGAAAILESSKDVERRIRMIANIRPVTFRSDVFASLLLGGFAGVGLTDAMPAPQGALPPAPVLLLDGDLGAAAGMTAREVLLHVAKTYRDARSYQDEGEVTTRYVHENRSRIQVQPFSTAFVREGGLHELFRYEYREGRRTRWQYVVWSDGDRIRSWWTLRPEVQEFDDFDRALSRASGRPSTTIPSLLIAGMQSRTLRLRDAEVAGIEAVDGHRCIKITGIRGASTGDAPPPSNTLWVDAESFLIRRTFERRHVDPARLRETVPSAYAGKQMGEPGPPFDAETTTTYRPRLDVDLPQELFTFEPPQ